MFHYHFIVDSLFKLSLFFVQKLILYVYDAVENFPNDEMIDVRSWKYISMIYSKWSIDSLLFSLLTFFLLYMFQKMLWNNPQFIHQSNTQYFVVKNLFAMNPTMMYIQPRKPLTAIAVSNFNNSSSLFTFLHDYNRAGNDLPDFIIYYSKFIGFVLMKKFENKW